MSDVSGRPDGFVSRWARRKAQVRQGGTPNGDAAAAAVPALEVAPEAQAQARAIEVRAPPVPTLEDVAQLGRHSEFGRFVAADVPPEVKNAAMKKLFADPHFNVMDGLDTYIDDYGKPEAIAPTMLRQMVQAQALGLFADEDHPGADSPRARATPGGADAAVAAPSATETPPAIADDQDAAVRLQPLDAAGPPGAAGGAGQDAARKR
jgi:hypothetical protein